LTVDCSSAPLRMKAHLIRADYLKGIDPEFKTILGVAEDCGAMTMRRNETGRPDGIGAPRESA